MSHGEPSTRPVGRRPGDPQETRDEILAAARRLFADRGYEGATIRSIAADADVDPASVIHHFGNKEGVFVAAHELAFDPVGVLRHVAGLPVAERGQEVARIYLSMAASPNSGALSLIRGAATNEQAARMLNEFITSVFLAHAAELIPGPDSERRLALVGAHMVGIIVGRSIIRLDPLVDASIEELIELVAPTIQRYLDGG